MNPDWIDILTAIVAAVALLLSVYNLHLTRSQHKLATQEKTRQLKLSVNYGFQTFGGEVSEQKMIYMMVNPGHLPITVQVPHLELPGCASLAFILPGSYTSEVSFPHDLPPGKNYHVFVSLAAIESGLRNKGFCGVVKCIAKVSDAVGDTFTTPVEIDLQ